MKDRAKLVISIIVDNFVPDKVAELQKLVASQGKKVEALERTNYGQLAL